MFYLSFIFSVWSPDGCISFLGRNGSTQSIGARVVARVQSSKPSTKPIPFLHRDRLSEEHALAFSDGLSSGRRCALSLFSSVAFGADDCGIFHDATGETNIDNPQASGIGCYLKSLRWKDYVQDGSIRSVYGGEAYTRDGRFGGISLLRTVGIA